MKIETHVINNTRIAEVISDEIIINTPEDALDILGNLYYQDFDKIILYERNITSDFSILKTGWQDKYYKSFPTIVLA